MCSPSSDDRGEGWAIALAGLAGVRRRERHLDAAPHRCEGAVPPFALGTVAPTTDLDGDLVTSRLQSTEADVIDALGDIDLPGRPGAHP